MGIVGHGKASRSLFRPYECLDKRSCLDHRRGIQKEPEALCFESIEQSTVGQEESDSLSNC